jgi:beta-alanine--pyruvate transaminase
MTVHQNLKNAPSLDAFWMPFTANRQFKAKPRLLASAKGMYYRTDDGREVLDGCAGLWCVNAGHGRQEIAEAVGRQVSELDFAPTFQMAHPLAFQLAERLTEIAPKGLDRIFFTNSGSESVDTALKIAFAYHRVRGEGQRTKLIGREKGYHGVGFGGISVGGLVNNRRMFPTLQADHLPHTLDIARNAFSKGQPPHGLELADSLEGLLNLHGPETVAAVIVEPVSGSAGVIPAPEGYLQKLRATCDKYGVLLIFDEVITGFGRLGQPFAAQYFGVTPDLMTTAKGITNGNLPMGAVFARREIHDTFMTGPETAIELFHGYTYSAHPVACAAALATLDIYKKEGLLTRAADLAPKYEAAAHALKGLPNVIDIRNLGLMAAVELRPREGEPGSRGYEAMVKAFESGLLVRLTGDTLAFSPPLIVSEAEIDRMFSMIGDILKGVP